MDAAGQAARKAFDAIDANNIGQAEVTVENGLKKFPQHHALLAAEALLQFRNGKLDIARERAIGLAQREDLRDPMAIDSLAHVLQQVGGWAALAAMYQRVAAQLPDSINVHENLFQTYIRMGSFVEAQRVALALHKKAGGTTKHQAWAVLAMLAQVPPTSTDHLLLKLSTKLLESSILTTSGVATSETTKAYVDVLIQQQRYDDALAFLQSKRGARVGLVERRLEIVRSILLLQGRERAAAAVAKQLWHIASDDWRYVLWYVDYISTCEGTRSSKQQQPLASADEERGATTLVFEGPDDAAAPSSALTIALTACDETFQEGLHVARHLQSLEATARREKMRRGPFLAELELLKRLIASSAGEDGCSSTSASLWSTLRDAVSRYCDAFATKPVCFMDVAPYLRIERGKGGNDAAPVAEAVFAWCATAKQRELAPKQGGSGDVDVAAPKKTLRYYQVDMLERKCKQLAYDPNVPRPANEVLKDMVACRELYDESRFLSSSLGWSEEGLCDGYLSCAMTIAVRQYAATRDTVWLMHGLDTFRRSQRALNNPSWLMVAVQMLRLLGVVDTKLTKQLDFKSVQFDTMKSIGHTPLVEGGALKECEAWDREANKFYSSMGKETSRLRVKVFQFFTWPVWKDLLGFEEKIQSSVVRLESIAAFALSGLRQCQTQRDLFLHVEGVAGDVRRALEFATTTTAAASALHSNEDTTVMRAALVEDVQSTSCATIVEALLGSSSSGETQRTTSARVSQATDKLALFCVVHDHVLREMTRQQQKNQQVPKAKKSGAVDGGSATTSVAPPLLSTFRATVDAASWPAPLEPLMACLVASLSSSTAAVSAVTNDAWKTAIDSTAAALKAAVAEGPTRAMLCEMPWCVNVLSALLQGASAQLVPVARLADALKLVQADWRAAFEVWRGDAVLGNPALAVAGDVDPQLQNDLLALQGHKLHQLDDLMLGDFSACCTAASKRR